jgi:hypothetical protein
MRRPIAVGPDAIAGSGKDVAAAIDEHGTDRHFAPGGGRRGFG